MLKLKKEFESFYGLSYRYAGELKKTGETPRREIIETANSVSRQQPA